MGAIGGLVAGSSGGNYQAATANGVLNPVDPMALQRAQAQQQQAFNDQRAFLGALQGQNGIANQSGVFGQEQGLAAQLQNMANGNGPNPAAAQLAQATGANTATQAALMAGQRGAGTNPGLIARQAGMEGGANQQQAAGQAATMRAQQQIAALNALQNQQGMMAGLSTNQVGQQAGALQNLTANAQGQQNALLNAQGAYNNANISQIQAQNEAAQAEAANNAQRKQGMWNGIGGLAGAAAMPFMMGGGAAAPGAAAGGMGDGSNTFTSSMGNAFSGPMGGEDMTFSGGQHTAGGGSLAHGGEVAARTQMRPEAQPPANGPKSRTAHYLKSQHMAEPNVMMAHGGQVPVMVSPGEKYLPPKDAKAVANGKADPMKKGEKIPGKAKVPGDSYANDTVPRKFEAGGCIIPRSMMESGDSDAMQKFVAAHMAKHNIKRK